MQDLRGKVALVTGASSGLGESIAKRLALYGVRTGLAVRSEATGARVADEIAARGGDAFVITCDVSVEQHVERAVEAVTTRYGGLDILINSAGTIDPIGSVTTTSSTLWRRSIEVNLIGTYYGVRYAVPALLARGGGSIVCLSSNAARKPFEGWSAYCAAKAGVSMLVRSVDLEFGSRGVRAVSFMPGAVDTQMQSKIRASGVNPASQVPREKLLSAAYAARAAAWLCSAAGEPWRGRDVHIRDEEFLRSAGDYLNATD